MDYFRETGVLIFGNWEASVRNEEMAVGIIAHIDRAGLAVRFTLENASAVLLPHFRHPIDRDDAVAAGVDAGIA